MSGKLALIGSLATVYAFDGGNKPVETPTEPEYENVTPATIAEYGRSTKAACGGSMLDSKESWTDASGYMFEYGCLAADDTRILTRQCEDYDDCGQWMWAGETRNTCYDDGSTYYRFMCGDEEEAREEVAPETTEAETQSRKTASCETLGWPLQPGDPAVCGYSNVNNGDCGVGNWEQSNAMCEALGARLCTADELMRDETKGTGCKGDCEHVWSSDACVMESGEAGHMEGAGAKKCANKFPTQCASGSASHNVRCCADAGAVDSEVSDFPKGFSPAMSSEYNAADGSCGVNDPIASYNCWVNPTTNAAMRFACSDKDNYVYHQFCDSKTCGSCMGPWSSTSEQVGQCYAGGNYVYQYACP